MKFRRQLAQDTPTLSVPVASVFASLQASWQVNFCSGRPAAGLEPNQAGNYKELIGIFR